MEHPDRKPMLSLFRERLVALPIALAAVSALGPEASAVEPEDFLSYQVGRFVIKPQLGFSATYDNNVFFRTNSKESDLITTVSPGIVGSYGAADANHISVSYVPNIVRYANNDLLNTVNHIGRFEAAIERGGLDISGSSTVQFLGGLIGGNQNFVAAPTDRLTTAHSYRLAVRTLPKLSATFAGSVNGTDFESGALLFDERKWRGVFGVDYHLSEKLDIIAEGFIGKTRAEPNTVGQTGAEADSVGGFVGVSGQFTTKLEASARVGIESLDFSNNAEAADGVTTVLEVAYKPSFRRELSLRFGRSYGFAIQSSSSGRASNAFDVQFRQLIGGDRVFWWDTSARYIDSNFTGSFDGRSDSLLSVSTGLSYYFREWLAARLAVGYDTFDSDGAGIVDYSQYRVTFGVSAGYR